MKKQEVKDFKGQREGEDLLFIFRRHIISIRKGFIALFLCFLLASIPFLIWPVIELLWLSLAGFVVGILIFSYHFLMWKFTYFLVTNERIRQVTQKSFFGTNVVDLPLSKIQSISYSIPGFFGDIFHFGTITIHTYIGDLIIHKADNPENIYNKLQDAIVPYLQKGEDSNEE